MWITLVGTVVLVAAIDIWKRYVPPMLLVGMILGTLGSSFWHGSTVSLTGFAAGLLTAIALPAGDVAATALCGLIVGPEIILWAEATAFLGLHVVLRTLGHRISLVQHPFFPYLGGMILLYTLVLPMYFPMHFPSHFPLHFPLKMWYH